MLPTVCAGEALPNVEVTFGENDSDTTFWDVKLPDYAGLLTADLLNRKAERAQLIALFEGSDWV